MTFLSLITFVSLLSYGQQIYGLSPSKAVVVLNGKSISGTINIVQTDSNVIVSGEISGLKPGQHGFHIHEFGDLTQSCKNTGVCFNPDNREHGSPKDSNRHVGDLGNILANRNGKAVVNIDATNLFSLNEGPNPVIGRSLVVHEKIDDFGQGGHPMSKTIGNVGDVVACGIIGWAKSE